MEINLNGSGIGINNYSEVLVVDIETRNTFCENNSYNQDTLLAYANQLAHKNITTVCKPIQTNAVRITQDKVNKTSRSTFPRITDNALLGNCIDDQALACQNESTPLDVHFIIDLSTPALRQVGDLATYLDQLIVSMKERYGGGLRASYTFLTPIDNVIDTSTQWTIQHLAGPSIITTGDSAGITYHLPVACATVSSLKASYHNGNLGVGATLTASENRTLMRIDGYQPLLNDRILVKDQLLQQANGIYVVTDLGSGSKPYVLTRSNDFDGSSAAVTPGWATTVSKGLTNSGLSFVSTGVGTLTSGTHAILFGVDAVVFTNSSLVKYSCVTPSIVDYLNVNNSKLLLTTSNSRICPYDIVINNLIRQSSFSYGTVITDSVVVRASDIKTCRFVRRSLAYLQLFVISNRSFTLSDNSVIDFEGSLDNAVNCSVNISPIVTNGQLTSDFSKAFNVYRNHGVEPYTVFNAAELFSIIHGQIKKYYDGLFISVANNVDKQYLYQTGQYVKSVKGNNVANLAISSAVDFSAYDTVNDFLAVVSGNQLQVIKLAEYRLVAKYTYDYEIVGLAFDKYLQLSLLTQVGTTLSVLSIQVSDLSAVTEKYVLDISSYGVIPVGSIRFHSPKAVDVDFLTFAVNGDGGSNLRYTIALRQLDGNQATEVLPHVGSFVGFDSFTNRFYILDALTKKILRFDGLAEYFFDGLSNATQVYDVALIEVTLDEDSGHLIGFNGTSWLDIDLAGASVALGITQEVDNFIGIKLNLSCPEDYSLLSVHNVPFGGISNWSNRNKSFDNILVSNGGSTYRQYLDLIAGSTYTLTIDAVILDQVSSQGNFCVTIGFTGVSYQYPIHRTGPVTLLFEAVGGPCLIELFVSPFYDSKEIAVNNLIVCETKEIVCGLVENIEMTLKWGTPESVDIPRLPLNIFNAFLKLIYRNPTTPSEFKNTFLLPTCEGHTCIGDPPKVVSVTCNYGDTVDFWKQQGLGTVAQVSILSQNLTKKLMEGVTENKTSSVEGFANWLWSIPQSKSAVINDELTAYFPSYEDPVNILDTIEVYILANQVYPSGDFPPKHCDDYPAMFEDPGVNLSVEISYDDQRKVNHTFSKSFNRNDIFTTYGDFTRNLPSQWDTLTSLGNGVRGNKAAWHVAQFILDTPDGKQPDGAATLNQCSKPLKVVLSGTGAMYVFPGANKPAPTVVASGNAYNVRPCQPQMGFKMVSAGRADYSVVSFSQPNATGGTYKVTFQKNGVNSPFVFELANGEKPEMLVKLLASRAGFVTAASDIGLSGTGTKSDPFVLAFVGRSQGIGYSITSTDGSGLSGAGSFDTEVIASGGAQRDIFTVKFKNSLEIQNSPTNTPTFNEYYATLNLVYGNSTYSSPDATATYVSSSAGTTASAILNFINTMVDSSGKSFGTTYGVDFVSVSPGIDPTYGPFTIGFSAPAKDEKVQLYFKTILANGTNRNTIDSRNKLSYDPVDLVHKSQFGSKTAASQKLMVNASGGSFMLGLPANTGTVTPRGIYLLVSYEFPNTSTYTASAPFNVIVSGIDKDANGQDNQYQVAITPDRCNTTSAGCDAFLACDPNVSKNIQYLKWSVRGINGACANNVYTSFSQSLDVPMSDWISKIVNSFDLTLTTVYPFAPNVNLSDEPIPSSVPSCDINCIVRVFADNGTTNTNTFTQVFSQVIKATAGKEFTKKFKVTVPEAGYVYTRPIQANAAASDVLAAVKDLKDTAPSDAVVELDTVEKDGSNFSYILKWNAGYAIEPVIVDTAGLSGATVQYTNTASGSYEICKQVLTLQNATDGYFSVNVAYGSRNTTTDAISIPFRDVDLQYALLNTRGVFPVDSLTVTQVQTVDPKLVKIYNIEFAPFMGPVPLLESISAGTIRCYPVAIPPLPPPPFKLPTYSCVEGPEDLLFSFCGITGDGPESIAAVGYSAKQLSSVSTSIKAKAELVNPEQRLTLRQMILKTNSGNPNDFLGYQYDNLSGSVRRVGLETVLETQTSYMIVKKAVYGVSYNFKYSDGVYEDAMIDKMSYNLYVRVRAQTNLLPGRIQPKHYTPKAASYLLAPVSSLNCLT